MDTKLIQQIKHIRDIRWTSYANSESRHMSKGKLFQSEKDYIGTFFDNYRKLKKFSKFKDVVLNNHRRYFGDKQLEVKPSLRCLDIFNSFIEAQPHCGNPQGELWRYKLLVFVSENLFEKIAMYIKDDLDICNDKVVNDENIATSLVTEERKIEKLCFSESVRIIIIYGQDGVIPEYFWNNNLIERCLRRSKAISIRYRVESIGSDEYFDALLENTPAALLQ
jgi:hypothetical protein